MQACSWRSELGRYIWLAVNFGSGFALGCVRAAVLLPALIIGSHLFGSIGLIYGTAVMQVVQYPFGVWMQRRYGVWVPWLDVVGFIACGVLIFLLFSLRAWLQI